ncbi:MAG: hypothetical protein KZQ88_08425 [Candidatus Thiodiazotropha sp. (ex Dulcina madagascariensis)]|nr:hypothetical protein [Candidatus Thiodiazotropha sp. (ex Dulcina madagascariensis)]MCU7925514.1 hypothetical protein [Candidatus Thiodiazotropha sp. (ex Dulcina madagascariensis)]
MNEIDLIPAFYRKRLLFTRWLKQGFSTLMAITVVVVGAFLILRASTEEVEWQLKQLQSQKMISTQQRNELEKLNIRKKDLTQQLDLLAGLRSGSAAEQIFVTVDKALSKDNVWLTNWRFRRAGTVVDKDPKTVNMGYFIVIPNGERPQEEEAWKIETIMTIQGQALDHSALSEFVSNLIEQPDIQTVRVVRTDLISLNDHKLVNFSLDIVVSSGEG